jgi:hypothetical protein
MCRFPKVIGETIEVRRLDERKRVSLVGTMISSAIRESEAAQGHEFF